VSEKKGESEDWQEQLERKMKEKFRRATGKSKAEELKEVSEGLGPLFETLAENLPVLVNALYETLYNEEAARQLGKAVGTFYQELRAGGIPEAEALSMAQAYMDNMKDIFREGSLDMGG